MDKCFNVASGNKGEIYESNSLLSISDCAKRLNLSDRTVYNHIKSGSLKANKVGKQWRIKPEDLEKYINGGEKFV